MKKQRSIMSFFALLVAVLFLTATAVIGTLVYGQIAQNRLQERFMDRITMSDTILADLYAMEERFKEFGRSWTQEEGQKYLETCDQLENDLVVYQSYCSEDEGTMNSIRRLNNFNIYQRSRVEQALNGDADRFAVYSYVLTGLNQHQQHALEMAQTDMQYARTAYETASRPMFRKMTFVSGAFAFTALVMSVVLIRFSVMAKRALTNMTDYFNHLAVRDWDTPNLEPSQYQEFTLISETANRMKQEIRNYIKEIKNRAKLEKQLNEERLINEKQHAMLITAQMSALRAQVNPHFLFNSLNMIGVTALVGDSKVVMQMVEATGQILRYSLYHQETMTLLDEELKIVEQYLFLQKCRFSDAVNIEIHNDLEGEDIEIPTMSIQPIVENSFKHGFGNKKRLHIHISVIWDEDLVSICVTDDGIGFDPERVQEKDTGGIGLSNIRKRLELIYGAGNARMEIDSEPGVYSSVTLLVPQEGAKT